VELNVIAQILAILIKELKGFGATVVPLNYIKTVKYTWRLVEYSFLRTARHVFHPTVFNLCSLSQDWERARVRVEISWT